MNLTKKSKTIIKKLQLPNGGILATPLESGYPYIYIRDAVIITRAYNKLGETKRSEKFYYFLKKHLRLKHYGEVFQRYTKEGLPSVTRKGEKDNQGLVLLGIADTYKKTKNKTFIEDLWEMITYLSEKIIKETNNGLLVTKASIHEYEQLEKGKEIWSNSACCKGLEEASKLAKEQGYYNQAKRWKQKSEKIKQTIKKELFDKKTNLYVKNPRYKKSPDMTILSPFYFEIIEDKKTLKKHLDYLTKNLWEKEVGGYRRFKKFENVKDWHWYTGGSGGWVVFTCWMKTFYEQTGNKQKSKQCKQWIEGIANNNNGKLPEHIATKKEYEEWKEHETEFNARIINEMKQAEKVKKIQNKEIVCWANPLGWSHAEYLLMEGGEQ